MKKIIIIGSGIGGLTAGNLLAKKGNKVTIFEAHSMPGGYTAGFYRKGYYFGEEPFHRLLLGYADRWCARRPCSGL